MRPASDAQQAPSTSRTALGVCALRALHQVRDGLPKILDDPLAARLLGDTTMSQVLARAVQDDPQATGLRAHVVLRSRYTEDRLAAAVAGGVRQLVILGAGYDSFAYRQPDWAQALSIFEIDHPDTQQDKRERLHAAGIRLPDNLMFVGIDFETTSLREGLERSHLKWSEPIFFSCLGVLMYLSPPAAQALFELVAGFPAGSQMVFTFASPESAASELAKRAGALGEPWLSATEPDQLGGQLKNSGFSEAFFLDSATAQQRYFADRQDKLTAPARTGIGVAVV